MLPRRKNYSSALLVILAFALMVVANGCSNSSLPLGPNQATEQAGVLESSPAERDVFQFWLAPQPRATKLGGLVGGVLDSDLGKSVTYTADSVVNYKSQVEVDSDIFVYGRSEDLWVKFGFYSDYLAGDIQILEAEFLVGRRSVPADSGRVEITMEAISGTTMGDVLVNFEPHGFDFDPRYQPKLKLTLVGKDVPETRDGYHHHEPDDIEEIDVSYREYNGIVMKVVVITITVPGFSSYSLGGDEDGHSSDINYDGDDGYGDEDDGAWY